MIYTIFGGIYTTFSLGVRHTGYLGLLGQAFRPAC
jgi:hypothetical protein